MKILAMEKETPGVPAGAFQPLLQAEAERAWALYQEGLIRELYFRSDRHEAVLMLECDNLGAAAQALNSLPLVQAGLITFDLIPLEPYTGFARLFARSPASFT
jgi:muconolactone delta-isomerase